MVSAQVKGKLNFYRRKPDNSMVFIYGNNIAALGPSGSSDGTIASTPDTWINLAAQLGEKVLQVNDQLVVTMTLNTAATTDASDGEVSIPISYKDGSTDSLSSFDDSSEWDAQQLGDTAFLAGVETVIAAKTVRKPFALGGGKIFVSVEDNA